MDGGDLVFPRCDIMKEPMQPAPLAPSPPDLRPPPELSERDRRIWYETQLQRAIQSARSPSNTIVMSEDGEGVAIGDLLRSANRVGKQAAGYKWIATLAVALVGVVGATMAWFTSNVDESKLAARVNPVEVRLGTVEARTKAVENGLADVRTGVKNMLTLQQREHAVRGLVEELEELDEDLVEETTPHRRAVIARDARRTRKSLRDLRAKPLVLAPVTLD